MYKNRSQYSESEYREEITRLWCDMVKTVYLKRSIGFEEIADLAWNCTNMTPLQYVEFIGDPRNLTNQIGRGQKAREKRWKKWFAKQQTSESLSLSKETLNES